ncbi:MAG TPA: hypothetical protein VLJ39_17995, partial [Tepidisphaeraceae bacterium]|nr:hypothetical protein [Tepidisphaeraceae bacterium]
MGWLSTFFGRSDRKAKEASDRSVGPQPVETAPRGELSDPLSLLAEQRGERDQFLRRLVSDGVWILALAPGSEFDPKSPDELLGHIREQARGLSQNRIGRPYMYSRAGSSVLPVFSTREAAEEFIKRLRITKATAFQCLQVRPGFWLANTFGLTRVFFNP